MEGLRAKPDPHIKGVWLVVHDREKFACIAYVFEDDVEDVEYDEAVSRYF